ncbi:MAG: hypothetical protein HOC70_08395 [Gammaproteobacteria bacterium]|jgi:hypothetical protein|nr:hypothetical protein [Gammaproteobacteria bacterium]MBT4493252.1 hypothetical protein [Gammaproteobacteria bacterium]MBT7369498.1 hypothetical protein [Gammaproteobacteria bacterium]
MSSNRTHLVAVFAFIFILSGCTSLVSGITSQMANDLADSIMSSEDIDTVREGVPAYLLLIDSFLRSSPDSEDLLLAASSLNGAFGVLIKDESRVKLLAGKSIAYAEKAACAGKSVLCQLRGADFKTFESSVATLSEDDVPIAYALAVAWVGWIQANSDDWEAISELGKAKLLMKQVIYLDENFENGGPHLYMGGMETILPASLGGLPEKGREHFERAIAINDDYLMTKVIYAEQYARLVFDQSLHDRLLNEVLDADPNAEGMTLTNLIAQERARDLLLSSTDYF